MAKYCHFLLCSSEWIFSSKKYRYNSYCLIAILHCWIQKQQYLKEWDATNNSKSSDVDYPDDIVSIYFYWQTRCLWYFIKISILEISGKLIFDSSKVQNFENYSSWRSIELLQILDPVPKQSEHDTNEMEEWQQKKLCWLMKYLAFILPNTSEEICI